MDDQVIVYQAINCTIELQFRTQLGDLDDAHVCVTLVLFRIAREILR